MSIEYCGKDWSEKPTYVEVTYLHKDTSLFWDSKRIGEVGYVYIGIWHIIGAAIGRSWESIFANLHYNYRTIDGSPKVVQDWFTHVYHLGLMLEDKQQHNYLTI